MGGLLKTGVNAAHDAALLAAEVTRQNAVANLTMNAAGQAAMNAAEIAWARACIASCTANNNNIGKEPFINVLKALGTGGA